MMMKKLIKMFTENQVCKHFIQAIEANKWGWFWECPNGNNTCIYRHALPPDYVLKKDMKKDKIVVDEMVTWFRIDTWEIVARKYSLSYNAGVYDFDVHMEVEMTKFGEYLVPSLMRYNGNWNVMLKRRERGVFTATLFDFKK